MNGTNIPRMRTLPEAARMLAEQDPETAYTLTALRRAVKRGEIASIEVASKRLINYDALLAHLTAPPVLQQELPKAGITRRIEL